MGWHYHRVRRVDACCVWWRPSGASCPCQRKRGSSSNRGWPLRSRPSRVASPLQSKAKLDLSARHPVRAGVASRQPRVMYRIPAKTDAHHPSPARKATTRDATRGSDSHGQPIDLHSQSRGLRARACASTPSDAGVIALRVVEGTSSERHHNITRRRRQPLPLPTPPETLGTSTVGHGCRNASGRGGGTEGASSSAKRRRFFGFRRAFPFDPRKIFAAALRVSRAK